MADNQQNSTQYAASITQAEIAVGLAELGVRRGDSLVVHTSLVSFGYVEGGAEAVVEALLDAVGPEGTAMFPTMTWRTSYLREPAPPWPIWLQPYDAATTVPDKDMGRVPKAALRHPTARRSNHPLMSVVAIGAQAETLTVYHPMEDPLRPYRRLAEIGGKVLLLGVDHTRNTTIHAAEFLMNLRHLSGPAYALVADPHQPGGSYLAMMAKEPDCSLGFDALNDLVARQERQIGSTIAWLCSGQEVLDAALVLLRQNPGALLCDHPGCRTCTRGRKMYAAVMRNA